MSGVQRESTGYQVCEKWLKDRRGRTLTYDDLEHYRKVVTALSETLRLMAEIDAAIPQVADPVGGERHSQVAKGSTVRDERSDNANYLPESKLWLQGRSKEEGAGFDGRPDPVDAALRAPRYPLPHILQRLSVLLPEVWASDCLRQLAARARCPMRYFRMFRTYRRRSGMAGGRLPSWRIRSNAKDREYVPVPIMEIFPLPDWVKEQRCNA
jgi:hypothetical protein